MRTLARALCPKKAASTHSRADVAITGIDTRRLERLNTSLFFMGDCFQLWRNPEFPASAIGDAADEVIPAAKIGERVIQLLEEEHLLD